MSSASSREGAITTEEHELEIERRELDLYPEAERAELTALYVAKGIPEDDASRMAGSLLSNPSVALDTMALEELGIDPELRGTSPWKAAGSSFALFCVGAIVPILPWMGRFSSSIAYFLADQLEKSDLRVAYREFLQSPACSPELRAALRDIVRKTRS